ncbi:MAG: RNase adapter RapZ, partial [Acidimicrobiales bacterium]
MSAFLFVTGMSGAGRSTAAATLEDLGWFVIDNLPPALITKVADLVARPGSESERVALVIGRGGGDEYVDDVVPMLGRL